MEAAQATGRTRWLGISNVSLDQLDALPQSPSAPPPRAKPPLLRRRRLGPAGARVSAANNILYQGFSLLTANRQVLAHPQLARIAAVTDGRRAKSCSASLSTWACFSNT